MIKESLYFLFWLFLKALDLIGYAALAVVYGVGLALVVYYLALWVRFVVP